MPRTTSAKPSTPSIAERQTRREVETEELRRRIERLEERIDESILGDDGLAPVGKGASVDKTSLEGGIDKSPAGDALKHAVRRSNAKRGSG